ncbi:hypothetical protein T10_7547 [Trichinella papuae]|uniref:Uncharacterized protein n=1 Tax=Trichinella papuae TaxID=268474 RepID=A0A0V1MM83_9BILA|nr:hypothetical protein T10_7547 [Trichinella papuae]
MRRVSLIGHPDYAYMIKQHELFANYVTLVIPVYFSVSCLVQRDIRLFYVKDFEQRASWIVIKLEYSSSNLFCHNDDDQLALLRSSNALIKTSAEYAMIAHENTRSVFT